jgi:hypothetical protein
MAQKRKVRAWYSESDHKILEERMILSPHLANQYIIEKNWRALHLDVFPEAPDANIVPELLPERYFEEQLPAIFHEAVWFEFGANSSTVAFQMPVQRQRTWVSVYGGQWQCEQTFVTGPLCKFNIDRCNE